MSKLCCLAACLCWLSLSAFLESPLASPMPSPEVFLSPSDTDASVETPGVPWIGDNTLYLWALGLTIDLRSVEFSFDSSLEIVELIPRPGVVNIGTVASPILQLDECRDRLLIAEVIVRDPTGDGGSICFRASDLTGRNCIELCDLGPGGEGEWHSTRYFGFASDGSGGCQGLDEFPSCVYPSATAPTTWGRLRHLYR